jgi:type III pantothenate kinase
VRILAVDAGNSRVKWGLSESGRWRALGAVAVDELERLAGDDSWRGMLAPQRIAVANVAGPGVLNRVASLVRPWAITPTWLQATAEACGVTNGYAEPGQLGVDRWAALVAARARHRDDCLVVLAGTATTIDHLDASGTFRGGMILPGSRLMKQALHQNTADLPLAQGEYRDPPRSTADAIETGCRVAQVAAIERAYRRLPAGAAAFVSGGAAADIVALLDFRVEAVEHLVLEGIVLLAQ